MPHAPDLSGRALDGRYELHTIIGEGTFGRVYRGRDRRLARPVAVKVIKPWWAEDPDWVLSFEREAQLLARVNDPGIVQIFDVGRADEGLYYVAELVDGESLAGRLRRGPLPAADACEIAEQLCRALAQAHRRRVVHRDVKPANILISADGRVKVGDFGVARLAEGSTDGAVATIVGTPRYMAPEQARGRPTTPASDVYGVGIVLYEMLTGHPPFVEGTAVELALRHLGDPPPPLPAGTPQVLTEIVDRALAKRPASRYASAAEMADALAGARSGGAAEQRTGEVDELATVSGPSGAIATLAPTNHAAVEAVASTSTTPFAAASTTSAATELLERAPDEIAATRVAAPMTPRRNVNPSQRRQNRAVFALVVLILLGMAVVAIATSIGGHVKVPDLRGLSRTAVTNKARHLNLRASFGTRYDQAARGVAIAQSPRPGTEVSDGATVRVVLSAGPAPVAVPSLVGQASSDAQAALRRLGLHGAVALVPAPGVGAGIVTRQSPLPGANVPPSSTVVLSVAETPRWRALTSFAGTAQGRSVPFRIRGARWQVVSSMSYEGTCTLLFFCSGPSAQVANLTTSSNPAQFDLGEGDGKTHVVNSGPGLYQITVSPGSDSARWSIKVEDYY
jgi:serine/threonine-protein kinase